MFDKVHRKVAMRRRGWRVLTVGVAISVAGVLAGCGSGGAGLSPSGKFVIGYQQGLGSAPLMLVEANGCLEDAAKGVSVEFKQFNSGSAIRDSMLADTVQAGAVGLSPFLIGVDKGIDWKILAPLNNMEFRLMTREKNMKSLADFDSGDQIAVPGTDSVQAFVLRKAAQEQLGDAMALENNLVSMAHPDAMQALLSDQVAGHMASAPYTYMEDEKGAHRVLGSADVFNEPINNTVVAVRQSVQKSVPEAASAVKDCIDEAINTLNNDTDRAAQLLEKAYGGSESAESIKADLRHDDLVWPEKTDGLELVGSFMKDIGMINNVPSLADVTQF